MEKYVSILQLSPTAHQMKAVHAEHHVIGVSGTNDPQPPTTAAFVSLFLAVCLGILLSCSYFLPNLRLLVGRRRKT